MLQPVARLPGRFAVSLHERPVPATGGRGLQGARLEKG